MKCVAVKGECISGFLGATVFSELKVKSVECRTLSFWEGQAVPEFTSYNLQYVDSNTFCPEVGRLRGITQFPYTEAPAPPPPPSLWTKPRSGWKMLNVPSGPYGEMQAMSREEN